MAAFFGILFSILIMLLPALIELKRPKDAGPRIILHDPYIVNALKREIFLQLMNIEKEKTKLNQTIAKEIISIVAFLPNIEAY